MKKTLFQTLKFNFSDYRDIYLRACLQAINQVAGDSLAREATEATEANLLEFQILKFCSIQKVHTFR